MPIEKITETELKTLGVSALPERPSAPSLYSGKPLTAEELRAAFDRLPTLLAQRFNALVEGAGLYDEEDPKDTLAALIATHMSEGHSLEDLFADIKSGVFASRMPVIGTRSLKEIIAELLYLTTIPSSSPTIRAYVDAPKGRVGAGVSLPVSGGEVYRYMREQSLIQDTTKTAYRLVKNADGSYVLMAGKAGDESSFTVAEGSDTLHFPADAVLDSGSLKECVTNGVPLSSLRVGDKYLDLVLANAAKDHVYVAVGDMVNSLNRAQSGTGDLVTDMTVSGNTVTVVYGKKSADILTEAKAYADSPKGAVSLLETRPVSGGKVKAALTSKLERKDLSPLYDRVKRLEDLSEGSLYSFAEANTVGDTVTAPAATAPFAVLSEIGGLSQNDANLLDQRKLVQENDLTVVYEPETDTLCFNGSLSAWNEILCLSDFLPDSGEASHGIYAECVSGEVSSPAVYLHLESDYGSGDISLALPTEPGTFSHTVGKSYSDALPYFGIMASEETIFVDYRCRILVAKGDTAPTAYRPFGTPPAPTYPTAITLTGKNLWNGGDLSGDTSLSPAFPVVRSSETVSISLVCASNDTVADTCLLEVSFFGQSSPVAYQLPRGVRTHVTFTAPTSVTKITLYASDTAAHAEGKHLTLSAIQFEKGELSPYTPYHDPVTVALPEALRDLEDYGHGLSAAACNTVDLLNGRYIQRVASLTLDGTEEGWQYENGAFTLSVSLTAPCFSLAPVRMSSQNALLSTYGASAVLTESACTVTTSRYTDVAAFKASLSAAPITFWYPTMERYTALDTAWPDTAFLPVSGNDGLTFAAEGEADRVFSRILFEIPNTTEVTQ